MNKNKGIRTYANRSKIGEKVSSAFLAYKNGRKIDAKITKVDDHTSRFHKAASNVKRLR